MRQGEAERLDELSEIDRKRSWIVVTSLLALVVLIVTLFLAPPTAMVVVAVIIMISLKKAAVSYRSLGKKRTDLLDSLSSGRARRAEDVRGETE